MKRLIGGMSFLGMILVATLAFASVPSVSVDEQTKIKIDQSFNQLPLRFEKNEGQTSDEVKFLSRGKGYTMFFTPTESAAMALRICEPLIRRE